MEYLVSILSVIFAPLVSAFLTTKMINYRLDAIEKKIENYDEVQTRIATLETRVEIYHEEPTH